MSDPFASATITAYTRGTASAMPSNPSYINDGNPLTAGSCGVGGAGGAAFPIRGFEADLGAPTYVDSISLNTRPQNGPTFTSIFGGTYGVGSYGTRLQYWDGSAWVDAAGSFTSIVGSPNQQWTYTLTTPILAQKWRVEFGGKQANGIWGGMGFDSWAGVEGVAPPTPVVADFHADDLTPITGQLVHLFDDSTGDPTSWSWDFGDGGTSTAQNPTHTWDEPGTYTVTLTASKTGSSDSETKIAYVIVSDAEAWDVYAADDLLAAAPIAVLQNAEDRSIRIEEDGSGYGSFKINRHDAVATQANLRKGNLVRTRFTDIDEDYIFAFFLETGDFNLLSSQEKGDEVLTFGGKGSFSYLNRARMDAVAYSTGLDISDTWEQIWRTGAIPNPVGSAMVGGDPTYLYVISATTRKVYKLRQSDRKVVSSSPALWSGSDNYAAGLGADPSDSTILWALEAPWSLGGSGNTKIRKIRISDWAVLDTFNLGSATKLTAIKASSGHLWTTKYDGPDFQKRSKSDGSVVDSYSQTYQGNAQVNATGISINGVKIAVWYSGKSRALISDTSDPETIDDVIKTTGLSAFGGDWTTEGGEDFFYPVSYTSDNVWKYQLTSATPHDPVSGEWRLDEGTPGAILARIMAEIQHPDRPQQPVPDLTYGFDFAQDTDGNDWNSHPGTAEFTARVGDFVDETILRLIPFGLTVQMDPNTLELKAYNDTDFGTDRSAGAFAAGKVRIVGGVNAAESLRARMDDRRVDSHMLIVGENGAFARTDDDDLGYVREGFISTSLSDTGAMEGTGDAELARQRRDDDAEAVVIPWGDDELNGLYLPGPSGTNGHYWVGDTIRIHSGTGEFDLNEQNREVKAITITEIEDGEWEAVVDLQSIFRPIYDPAQPVQNNPSSVGGTSGAGSTTTTVKQTVTIKDSVNGESYAGTIVESDDWGVAQSGIDRVSVTIRRKKLGDLSDVELDAIADGQGLAWDDTLQTFVPVTLVDDHGGLTGLADDDHPQYATNVEFDDHSARHADGGADELPLEDLPTSEMDTTKVPHPDGAGGVVWGTDSGGGGGGGGGGGVIAIPYTFDSTTGDADPGAGFMRLSNASQYLAVTARLDLTDADGADVTAILDDFADPTGTVKGYMRIQHATDPTKWLVATVSAVASPSGYRNVTIANVAKSANSPFTNGDDVIVAFDFGALPHASSHNSGGSDALSSTVALVFELYGGSAVLPVNFNWDLLVPFACTITKWTILADVSGAIVLDLWKDTYGNYPPTVADTITAAAKPTITASGTKGQSSTLTGWTTAVAAGDTIRVNVDSVTSIKRATLILEATRTV